MMIDQNNDSMDSNSETTPLVRNEDVEVVDRELSIRHAVIVPLLVCYFLAFGIYMYALPEFTQLTLKKAIEKQNSNDTDTNFIYNPCNMNKTDPEYDIYTEIQQQTAMWSIYYQISSSIPALFGNIVLGTYSDVLGRRFVFTICTAGSVLKLTVFAVVVYFDASLIYIIPGNIVEGMTGSFTTVFAVTFSFVADITGPGRKRTLFIVLIELLLGVTITASTLGTGYFIKSQGFFYPALTSCVLSVVCLLCVIFGLPETLRKQPRRDKSKSFFVYIGSAFTFYCKQSSKVRQLKYVLLILSFLFIAIPNMNRLSLETLYQLGRPFCWTATEIGLFGALKTGLASFLGIGAVFVLQKCLADDSIGVVGALTGIVSFVVEGLATSSAVLLAVPALACMSYIPIPMLRSLMSHLTPADQQGALFASIGFVETICSLVGSLTNNIVYAATLSIMNGFVFLLCAVLAGIGMCFLLVFMYVERRTPDDVLIIEQSISSPLVADAKEIPS